jgi:hypothetical protein
MPRRRSTLLPWRALLLSSGAAMLLSACGAVPDRQPARPASAGSTRPIAASPAGKACFDALSARRIGYSPLPNQRFAGGCSQIDAVLLRDVGTPVSNLGPVTCPLAERFAGWIEFGVTRAADQILGSSIARIETFGSYSCRTIAGSGKLSQHAHANAIDVAAFVLTDGRRISVAEHWRDRGNKGEFLRAIHASACRRFGTVLSPDYDAAHRDHFHVDMGAGNGGRGFCR